MSKSNWQSSPEVVGSVEAFKVVFVVEHHGIGFMAVASGTACLLEVGFDGRGDVEMDDKAYIGFVNPHAEGIGGHHDRCLSFYPAQLCNVAFLGTETGVIVGGGDAVGHKELCYLSGATAVAYIHDAAAAGVVRYPQQAAFFVSFAEDHVGKVGTAETGLVEFMAGTE